MKKNLNFFPYLYKVICLLMLATPITMFVMEAKSATLIETPFFVEKVDSKEIPPIDKRVPVKPNIINVKNPGKHGGQLKMFIGRTKDIRLMVVYGYSRLVGYNESIEIVPDILEKIDVKDKKSFTFFLRPGHKWSDGHPFTTEDFRYWWEDVANNKELSPAGPPVDMIQDGNLPKFEIINETTLKYTWDKPNNSFLHRLASASPLFIYRPAHYLKKFHANYNKNSNSNNVKGSTKSWAAIHNRKDNLYKFDNPDLPTLQPWVNTTKPPATRFVFVRNPFFHRIDQSGLQLPYIDTIVFSQVSSSLIAAKTGSGESDLQARNISLKSFPFLKKGEKRNNYKTLLWNEAKGSHYALFPNLNVNDPILKKLFRDVRFRRALSMSIDREMINEALYFGLAIPSNNTVLPESPLFKDSYQTVWTEYDPSMANNILDQIGTIKLNKKGTRELEDGRELEIIVETAGESEEETDLLELIKEGWAEIGIKLFTKPSQREVLRNRIFSGQTMMAIWSGLENGVPTAEFEPRELAVTTQHQYQWPQWGQFYETQGRSGEKTDLDSVIELNNLLEEWKTLNSREERAKIWHKMLSIYTDNVFSIGIISGVKQPIVVRKTLRNVPKEGIYNWDPGAHFGIYKPDTFWFDK